MASRIGQTDKRRPLRRAAAVALALLVTALTAVAVGRTATSVSDFGPAAAASLRPSLPELPDLELTNDVIRRDQRRAPALDENVVSLSAAPAATPVLAPAAAPTEEPVAAATPRLVETIVRPTNAPVRTVAPPVATLIAGLGATCPVTWFCYPRVGLAGPIVPYADCSGSTDVGTSIRSYTCLSDHYLLGHAYTPFGLIRQWVPGDIVYAYGTRYTLTAALTQSACSAPKFPLAALSLQTSLTSRACGDVLVVQGR